VAHSTLRGPSWRIKARNNLWLQSFVPLAQQMRPPLSAIAKNLGLARNAFRVVLPAHFLPLADQAVVSGTSLLTTLLIARWSNPTELGIYVVGASLLLSVLAFQESLILEPYLIQRHDMQGSLAEGAGSFLTLSVLFSTGSILILIVLAVGFLKWGTSPELVATTWLIAGIIPFALTRNFARRFSFARLEFGHALVLDTAVALIQISMLAWLGTSGRMSALSAWAAFGAANAVAAVGWLYCARREFAIRLQHVRTVLKRAWPLGKWLLVGQITALVQGNIAYWLLMGLAGAAETGVFAACMSIVGFANPLLLGLGNSMMPRSVFAWKNNGARALWHEMNRSTVLIAVLMTAFSLAILIAGEPVMRLLFHGAEYDGHRQTLTVLALSLLAGSLGAPAQFALAAMQRPRLIVVSSVAGAIVTVVLVLALMGRFGLVGAAYGFLGGSAAGSIGRWVAVFVALGDHNKWRMPTLRRIVTAGDLRRDDSR
jgi:O-antigen/teichoic acid export membrane protein